MENLQTDIQDLNGIFHEVRSLVQDQSHSVQAIADNADEALEQVTMGESNLRRALAYKKTMYPVFGALIGTCVGGPIGMVVGMKAAGLAAVGCGLLGFTGGSVLKSTDGIALQGSIEEQHDISKKKEWPSTSTIEGDENFLNATNDREWTNNTRELMLQSNNEVYAQHISIVTNGMRRFCSLQ